MGVVGDADFFLKNRTAVKPDDGRQPAKATETTAGQAATAPEMIGGSGFAK